MSKIISILSVLLISWCAMAAPTAEQPDRNTEVYNLDGNLGLKGYDPVSYFTEGGGAPQEGLPTISTEYGEVTYFFSSEENKNLFLENPTKYESTYGGWCAWAMANKGYADIDPTLYTINGNRAHFFINRGAKFKFDQDIQNREPAADTFWKTESGEEARK